MSLVDDELARAESGSTAARKHLADTVAALQTRLKPSALARDAIDEIREIGNDLAQAGVETIRRSPLRTFAGIAALTAFIARKPLARLFHRASKHT